MPYTVMPFAVHWLNFLVSYLCQLDIFGPCSWCDILYLLVLPKPHFVPVVGLQEK